MNFDDMPSGLVGNNSGWSNPEGKVIIKEIPGIGKVISSDGVKVDERHDLAMYTNPEPFGIQDGSKIAVEFDLMVKTEYGTALLGIGDAGENPPLVMGALSADVFTRSYYNYSLEEKALDEDGVPYALSGKKWYRMRCVLDLSADIGTMEIKCLDEGDFRPVYFDKAQTKRGFTLGMKSPKNSGASKWQGLYFRFQEYEGAIDNIRIIQL